MAQPRLERLLTELEAARYGFGPGDGANVLKLVRALDEARFPDTASLIRFHEALMFVRAFPQNAAVVRAVERILNRFHDKVEAIHRSGADMEAFDTYEYSGIAGTTMEEDISFDVAHWLVRRMPGQVEIAWDNYEPGLDLGTTGPRFMPLLEDDTFVEPDTPFRRWLETARPRNATTAGWLVNCFDRLALPPLERAALYESLRVPLRWSLGNSRITRTRNWRSPRKPFYHHGPLISRSQVSLAEELSKSPPTFTRLSLAEGQRIVNLIREVMFVRYRELYGATLADPRSVVKVNLGANADSHGAGGASRSRSGRAARGIEIYLWTLPPERRLPLRAYVAGFTLKNGVPINYFEAIGLCEWMELGFNTFYTFRGGETGWVYAQVLRSLCTWMGISVISVYPYQLGHENEEAIESGAFWFYRKLGFRPGRPELLDLVQREEEKIAANRNYRTPARTLKRLAAEHVFFELNQNELNRTRARLGRASLSRAKPQRDSEVGAWDTFSTRNIGFRVNQRMARQFAGDSDAMRAFARRDLERALDVRVDAEETNTRGTNAKIAAAKSGGKSSWNLLERQAFDNFALILCLDPNVRRWTLEDKEDLLRIIRAKSKPDELLYLRLSQRHQRLRQTLLKLGSSRIEP